jgi:ketosteroid isomerase-like protein
MIRVVCDVVIDRGIFEGAMTERFVKLAACVLPVVGLALGGCQKRDESLPGDVTSALETAFNRGDVDACVAVYTDDAEIIPEDGPVVRGKKAIQEFFKDQVQRDTSFDTDSTLSIVREDLAVEQGTYRVRDVQRGVDVEYGEYLNVWRQNNGGWRVLRSMYNVTMAQRGDVSVTQDEETPAPSQPPQSKRALPNKH